MDRQSATSRCKRKSRNPNLLFTTFLEYRCHNLSLARRDAGLAYSGVLDTSRRILLNFLFLLLLIVLVVAFSSGAGKRLDDKTALVLNLTGRLVEQQTGNAQQMLLAEVRGGTKKDPQLRDVLLVLEAAAKDAKISSVVLLLDDLDGAGLPMLREVAAGWSRCWRETWRMSRI